MSAGHSLQAVINCKGLCTIKYDDFTQLLQDCVNLSNYFLSLKLGDNSYDVYTWM